MNCDWVRANSTFYVYDELTDDSRHEMEAHLARCEDCKSEVEAARLMREVMDARPRLEPSPNLLAASRMRLQEALETTEQSSGWSRWMFDPTAWLRQVRFSPALAAVILMVGFAGGALATWTAIPKNRNSANLPADVSSAAIAGIRGITQDPNTNKVSIKYERLVPQQTEGSIDDPQIQQLLVLAARNQQNSGLRMDSVDLLMRKPEDNNVREALMYSLRYDTNPGVRLKAVEALRDYVKDDVRVRDAMLEALVHDVNPGVRAQAIRSLQVVRADTSVRQALSELAERDQNVYIRTQSRRVLATLPEID